MQNRNEQQRNRNRRGRGQGGGQQQGWQGQQEQGWNPGLQMGQQYDPRAGQFVNPYQFSGQVPQFGVGGFFGPTVPIPGVFSQAGGLGQQTTGGRRRRRRGRGRGQGNQGQFLGNGTFGRETQGQNPLERAINQQNYTGLAPKNYHRSDTAIQDDAYRAITKHGGIDPREIEVTVARDGIVHLKGTVPTRRMKLLAEDTISRVPGVKDVHNEIRVLSADELLQKQEADLARSSGSQGQFRGGQSQRSVS